MSSGDNRLLLAIATGKSLVEAYATLELPQLVYPKLRTSSSGAFLVSKFAPCVTAVQVVSAAKCCLARQPPAYATSAVVCLTLPTQVFTCFSALLPSFPVVVVATFHCGTEPQKISKLLRLPNKSRKIAFEIFTQQSSGPQSDD